MATLVTAPPAVWRRVLGAPDEPSPRDVRGLDLKELAMRALDAARGAGAAYADVRLTDTWSRTFFNAATPPSQEETLGIGVRVLVNGYWGFASSPLWLPDEAARLGRVAAELAKTNAIGPERAVELGTVPVVTDGRWASPMEEDPFTVPFGEVMDLLRSWQLFAAVKRPGSEWGARVDCAFWRQAKVFASTEGTYLTQQLARTRGGLTISYSGQGDRKFDAVADLPWSSKGWEYVRTLRHRDAVERLFADIDERRALPEKPVEVGRYDVVFDAPSIASLLDDTLGAATELDRALGYEANAGGTSYLADPLAMLGSQQVGAPLLTVTANRSMPGGVATVRWDDEGVAPDDFTLVKEGVLTDFQTTRESAAWLAPWYRKLGRPVRSHGCATGATAEDPSLQATPNLALSPGGGNVDFDDLVDDLGSGIAITRAQLNTDFQHVNGLGHTNETGAVYEIKRGKKVALVTGAGFLFRAPELWKGLLNIGGAKSVRAIAAARSKGEPEQVMQYTVSGPPAVLKQVSLIDLTRKA